MNELKRIVENIQSVFEESSYPQDFLDAYDQMECLASHSGRETFLVRRKKDGEMAVAKCYDCAVFPFYPHSDLLNDLEHPGLPRFLEQYRNDRILCVVREYIEGEPLSDYVKDRQLTKGMIVSFMDQLCDILSSLHSHTPPVIHRDIKPENIIVKPDGTLALIDFDIARPYRENAVSDTTFFGTKGYAPPEQYGFGQTDNRTDIYALGVLLRWMVTGSVRENRNITMEARFQKVIDRCTAFSPEDRYADVRQIRKDLQKKQRRLSPGILAAAAVLMLGLLCAGFAAGRYTEWLQPPRKIIFSEPLIERAVRLQLGKEHGSLTEEDLAAVRNICIFGSEAYGDQDVFMQQRVDQHSEGPLRTLDDLQMLPFLEEVHIAKQGYLDVRGLADLPRVFTVELKHMRISGIQPVANISRLRHVVLFDCGLNDFSALENCPWLETLDIGLNDLTDLKQVGFHPNVRFLGAMWLNMKNLDGLAERMPKLQQITLQYSTFKDLSGLKLLRHLETVYVLSEQEDAVRAVLEGADVEVRVTEN